MAFNLDVELGGRSNYLTDGFSIGNMNTPFDAPDGATTNIFTG